MSLENVITRMNTNLTETTSGSRLVTLRNKIVEILSLGKSGNQFCESDFIISSGWFPAQDYTELVNNGGAVFVLARPSSSDAMTRGANEVVREEFQIQVSVIFSASDTTETSDSRIELHIQLCEEIQDLLRTAGDSIGYHWISTTASRSESGTPYHYMELAEGTFVSFIEVKYYKVSKFTN